MKQQTWTIWKWRKKDRGTNSWLLQGVFKITLVEADLHAKHWQGYRGAKQLLFGKIHLKATLRILCPTNSLKKCRHYRNNHILHRKPKWICKSRHHLSHHALWSGYRSKKMANQTKLETLNSLCRSPLYTYIKYSKKKRTWKRFRNSGNHWFNMQQCNTMYQDCTVNSEHCLSSS